MKVLGKILILGGIAVVYGVLIFIAQKKRLRERLAWQPKKRKALLLVAVALVCVGTFVPLSWAFVKAGEGFVPEMALWGLGVLCSGIIAGFGLVIAAFITKLAIKNIDVAGAYSYIIDDGETKPFSQEDYKLHKDGRIILNWVIPEPGIGGGGHTTIFRFVSGLEKRGIHNRIYLMYPGKFSSDEMCAKFVEKYYGLDCSTTEVHIHLSDMGYAHGTLATSWETAYPVRHFQNTVSKFYFVQDFEPLFFPVGSNYVFAENTYHFGFRGITAGDWLRDKLHRDYGMVTDSFSFSYDRNYYLPREKKDDKNRIFFYARPFTGRRAFEFGLLALGEVSKQVPDLEVVFAGEDVRSYKIDFPFVNKGVLPPAKLSELYAQCDMCLILSGTNLSLLPLEVMASNSVAVCTKGPNSDWLVNDENSVMVDFEMDDVVEKLVYYMNHKEELAQKRKKGMEFAQKTSWETEIEKVKEALVRGIREDEGNLKFVIENAP